MNDLTRDFRYAWRMLRKSPGFASIAILMLALGIGANTAIFSLVSTAFLRPLPFREPDRLVAVWEETPLFGLKYSPPSMANYVDWRSSNQTFADMGGLERSSFRLTGEGEPEDLDGSVVTASLFPTLGVKPALGRWFLPEEDRPGAAKVVMLSYGLWQRRFAGDPDVVGRSLPVNGEKYVVAGVMPRGFAFPGTDELWTPVGTSPFANEFLNRGRHNMMVVGRLRTGVTLQRANQDLRMIAGRLTKEYPLTNTNVSTFASPLREHSTRSVRTLYAVLLGAVGFVLLIACANLANMLLARAAGRQREIAVRAALGAGRVAIARQLLAESLLLAAIGAGLGMALAAASFRFLSLLLPPDIAAMAALGLDPLALGFTLGLTLLTAFLFGIAPIAQSFRVDLNRALKQGGARSGSTAGAAAMRNALVICEVALSLVLLAGAGLMIRSFARLRGVDPGFQTRNLLTMRVAPSFLKYREPAREAAFYRETLRRIEALPGVESAGFSTGIPVAFKGWFNGIAIEGQAVANGGELPSVNFRAVTPNYLQTLRVPLRSGRFVNERDGADSPPVAVINETMARQFWPGQDALGKRFKQGSWAPEAPWYTVVGIVGDMRQSGLDAAPRPEMYLPNTQQHSFPSGLAIRTSLAPEVLVRAIRREVQGVDPEQPVTDVRTMEEILDRDVAQRRLHSTLLGALSALALALASLGMYGVLSYLVARRTREIGIRLALGARPGAILSGVVRQSLALTTTGIVIGVASTLALTQTLSSLLYGVAARDPWTIGGAATVMLAVSVLASVIPARRAMNVDPMVTLREE